MKKLLAKIGFVAALIVALIVYFNNNKALDVSNDFTA